MNKFDIRIIFLFFFTLDVLSGNIGQPGELFPIKVNKGIFTSSNGLIKIDNSYYNALVNLSDEDKDRTIRESKIINKALQTYSKKMKPTFSFISPVDGIISSRYGKKRFINNSPRSPHLALDIAAPEGTKVLSPEDGKVILIGNFFYSGNYLIIDHGQGLLSSYSHLSSISVSEDDILKQGQEIGKVGSTGRVTGPHLHWTVYYEKVRINPESLLKDNYLEALL